ncbi:hypothetical protein SPRG_21566 [Saprolegnia parasitica CBS 223.65]|uniref:Uncharacterized protein n=1 Tax=Saprolegnia parasitica (strain CBS 223.65) TaxID=695850 RepID=A0A067BYM5_SAPPC|nr:hypothetical protein SPRG_21566 [Saprolegnia parasitica CBS 223.65]KDO19421.1 hypothetical protein SPRG_21566 [Saprolegnia parasitica CBS 223.65]|eukprot:XP_012209888.1 hypothetical protein SPRG_21566 [Saprolegnia parasitica CBS 223.65]
MTSRRLHTAAGAETAVSATTNLRRSEPVVRPNGCSSCQRAELFALGGHQQWLRALGLRRQRESGTDLVRQAMGAAVCVWHEVPEANEVLTLSRLVGLLRRCEHV